MVTGLTYLLEGREGGELDPGGGEGLVEQNPRRGEGPTVALYLQVGS